MLEGFLVMSFQDEKSDKLVLLKTEVKVNLLLPEMMFSQI